ncbi:LuxR C-terminal-related transcriptional regulator [Streptomyces echinatus]|uniref:DNA-binding NarL/FixJ family response regulator n=1 Tax=Streptomyces echinatus TaxID=67293 RepID=A0A7W9PS28_9ACTN|nr:response regulator transcription factor [Streptomyces echinatus]MBB5926227.1 DNA-binding NarL/FixJ family response regulator [Streptomyces echinatus]
MAGGPASSTLELLMSPSVTRLAVVCDSPLLQLGLTQAVDSQPDMEITTFAARVDELSGTVHDADVVLLVDLRARDQVVARQVARLNGQGRAVVVVSAADEQSDAVLCIKAGARGYLSRQTTASELLTAIRAVAAGRDYFGASLAGRSIPAPPPHITSRERQILRFVVSGATDREIAAQLKITENTVHTHLERLRRKCGSRRRAELTRFALENGITDDGPTELSRFTSLCSGVCR